MSAWRQLIAVLALPLLALAFLALPGCGGGDSSSSGTGASKKIVVGTEATFPPFETRDASGNFAGFDIDLVREVGKRSGFDVEFKDMGFDALIPALQAGQLDMIASGLSITDERTKVIDFSDPYMNAGIALAVRKDEVSIKDAATLKGKVAAVQQGSTGSLATEKLKEQGVIKDIKYYPTVALAMMELIKGGADVVISDRPTSEAYIAVQGDQVKLLGENLQADSYGLGIRKGNADLLANVNSALADLKKEGFLEELKTRHFKGQATAANAPASQPTTAPAAAEGTK